MASPTTPSDASREAKAVLAEAAEKAAQIIRDAKFAVDEVHQILLQAADRIDKQGQAQLKQLAEGYDERLAGISKEVATSLQQHIADTGAQTKQLLFQLERQFNKAALEQQQQLKQEFVKQQQQQLKQFEERLKAVLPQLLEDLVGHGFSLADHETIINERLQQLKQEQPWRT